MNNLWKIVNGLTVGLLSTLIGAITGFVSCYLLMMKVITVGESAKRRRPYDYSYKRYNNYEDEES